MSLFWSRKKEYSVNKFTSLKFLLDTNLNTSHSISYFTINIDTQWLYSVQQWLSVFELVLHKYASFFGYNLKKYKSKIIYNLKEHLL